MLHIVFIFCHPVIHIKRGKYFVFIYACYSYHSSLFFPRGQIVTEIAHAWIVLTVHFQNFLGHKRWPHMFSLITHECEDKKLFYKNNNKCHFIFH